MLRDVIYSIEGRKLLNLQSRAKYFSIFNVKWHNTGKFLFPFSRHFVIEFAKFSFWKEDCKLDYNLTKFKDFPNIF